MILLKAKKIILISVFILLIVLTILGLLFIPKYIEKQRIKNAKIIVTLKEDLTVPFKSDVKISDFIENINGTIIEDNKIDTIKVGEQTIKFKYINDEDITVPYKFKITVIDNTPPLIWLGGKKTVTTNFSGDLVENIMCADDTDDNPNCYIEGDYDTTQVGSYNLKFIAKDKYGNEQTKDFILDVKEPSKDSTMTSKTLFSDAINDYKKDNTKLGIDVSSWQGDIDFEKVKNAGVEFAIVRVGTKKGTGKEYILDSKFKQNIEGFIGVDIPVGLYFYSYASRAKEAKEDADWIIEQIKDYDIDLPIAYDWENWSNYNYYHLSLYNLSNNAKIFLDTLKKAGYEGMLYGSKNYLTSIWDDIGYPIWLAHYVKQTDYDSGYLLWQFCNDGVIDGINGYVDFNLMYTS